MKKLMIAAAIVCAAVATQAATVTWSTGKLYGADSATKGTTDVADYVKDIANSSWEITMKVFADQAMTELVTSDFVYLTVDGEGNATYSSAVTDGTAGKSAKGGSAGWNATTGVTVGTDTDSLGLDLNTTYYMQLLVDGETPDYTATKSSDAITVATKGASSKATFPGGSFGASNWDVTSKEGPTDVPEPTSGLLMLVGLAGMALRRRRA